jgi:hypothetical protein
MDAFSVVAPVLSVRVVSRAASLSRSTGVDSTTLSRASSPDHFLMPIGIVLTRL